jgi:hypothetical protein
VDILAKRPVAKDLGMQQVFDVPMVDIHGAHTRLRMCDYASAGAGWSTSSLLRVWLPQSLETKLAWQGLTPWSELTWTPWLRNQVPSPYIAAWWLAGPYPCKDQITQHMLEAPFAPESPGGAIHWRTVSPPQHIDTLVPYGVDLGAIFGGNNCVAYLQTVIAAEKRQNAMLEISGDGLVAVRLNGKLLSVSALDHGGRHCTEVALRPGRNTLRFKTCRSRSSCGWRIYARLLPLPGSGYLAGVHCEPGEVSTG